MGGVGLMFRMRLKEETRLCSSSWWWWCNWEYKLVEMMNLGFGNWKWETEKGTNRIIFVNESCLIWWWWWWYSLHFTTTTEVLQLLRAKGYDASVQISLNNVYTLKSNVTVLCFYVFTLGTYHMRIERLNNKSPSLNNYIDKDDSVLDEIKWWL